MAEKLFIPKYVKRILITPQQIERGVAKAAKWVNRRYAHTKQPPIILAILKGSIPFYTKLVMQLKINVVLDFIVMSSYRGQIKPTTRPNIVTDIISNIKGRDVIVVEDVVDTARSFTVLMNYLKTKKPKSLTSVVLADKPEARLLPFDPDFACFKIKGDPYLIGFGLDIKEIARNLPYVAEFDKKYLNKL